MATNFPTSVDVLTNPVSNDSLNSPSHSAQHANANDAIEAVEDYLLNGAGRTGLVYLSSFSATSGSSLVCNNAFNSTYTNYRLVVTFRAATSSQGIAMTLGASSANYYYGVMGIPSLASNGLVRYGSGITTTSSAFIGMGCSGGNNTSGVYDITNPNVATQTSWNIQAGNSEANNGLGPTVGGAWHTLSTAYTDFTLTLIVGTITSLKVDVYGYR
jgi:hypothetical protein